MIRNIVFDLGNVLISFRPDEYLIRAGYADQLRKTILNDIFRSTEWLQLDNGDIKIDEAINMISGRSSLTRSEITEIFRKRTEIMFPLEQNAKIIPGLKKAGYSLFYLSNFPADIFNEIRDNNSFFSHFDGGIISAHVKFSKPDPEIYRMLIKMYSLVPCESLYVDDNEINVKTAESLGMKGCWTNGSEDIMKMVRDCIDR